jgi:hypothetical protein
MHILFTLLFCDWERGVNPSILLFDNTESLHILFWASSTRCKITWVLFCYPDSVAKVESFHLWIEMAHLKSINFMNVGYFSINAQN